ncbi:MAG: hypothetical protein AABW83_03150 [Nanoarchaeota archaeon]
MKSFFRKEVLIIFILFFVLFSVGNVYSYKLYCLGYGQSLPTQENPRYTCYHDVCQICTTDANNPTHPARCNNVGSCQPFGNGGNVDVDPPILNVISPVDNGVYNSKLVLFDIRTNEPSSLSYIDNIRGRGVIKSIASNVNSYSRELNFKDGENSITIFAKDRHGNEAEKTISFFVDSKSPKIIKTNPSKDFANGIFEIQFIEENPKKLIFNYGNEENFRNTDVDLNECNMNKGKNICTVVVNLNDYDGQIIKYLFELEDISGKKVNSKNVELNVDTSLPVLLNPNNFWIQGEGDNNKFIYFDMEIDEDNFKEAVYLDNNGRDLEKKICSRLKDNKCVKKFSFRNGHHELDVVIRDKAGNSITTQKVIFHV